ncbi:MULTISPECIES: GNAT family N-acetyltransferase [Kitasatospora]|uniref:Putative acetyltransferase n=1 Tax=Kitasatospora setae (strain ATCC 33774 / DSM 43861 / JCM 3304 / KCC A-0304 / NBRC 14216 / KM-6054) TaxID=452652 RepID=E4NA11_KITSK|nr:MULTISPECIES: GNAT family N-acetyltransferase [Kitasatospora]BAJ28042.1 putative acetyltransferase [Kitasatospora setae KM-6054]
MTAMPSNDVIIRPALDEDERAIRAVDHAIWSPVSEVAPRSREDAPVFDRSHTPDQYLLAELDGRVVGYVRQVREIPLPSNAHVRQIQGLGVLPEARGRGVGDALLTAACAAARTAGARRITLRVLGPNAPARRLYERNGFEVLGVLPEHFLLEGGYADDVWMGRALD